MSLPIRVFLGGSFDPVHLGHMCMAKQVQGALPSAQIYFMPLSNPPHKTLVASQSHRLSMLKEALKDTQFLLDKTDLRTGTIYTKDTVRLLRSAYADDALVFVMGMDSFLSLTSWEGGLSLVEQVHLLVFDRDNTRHKIQGALNMHYRAHQGDLFDLSASKAGRICILEGVLEASSTQIRQNLAGNVDAIKHLMAPEVLDYIKRNELYVT